MADGTKKPIEDVAEGDKVIATDPETGKQEARAVDYVYVHEGTVIDLVVDGEIITTSEDHPFWSVTDEEFERADELTKGERVLDADGDLGLVTGLNSRTARQASISLMDAISGRGRLCPDTRVSPRVHGRP